MKLKKQQDRGRKHAKILAAMLVFLLCGCNHRDTEYKLSDSTGGSTAENVFGNQKEVDEEQTVSEKSAGETTGIPEKREAQEAAPEETVQVYICGAVASPGVYTLPGGSRVVQAVEAAGGFLPDAEEKILNLARKIEDGEQITVWTREEAENMEITDLSAYFKSIVFWKHDIQKNHIILFSFYHLKCFLTVVCAVNLHAVLLQAEADSFYDQFFIINYKNFLCHFFSFLF